MTQPEIFRSPALGVEAAITTYAPSQGGIEYQTDQPDKIHSWHSHDVHETLVVLNGSMKLSWKDSEGTIQSDTVAPGARIELPAHTVHESVAGDSGCNYLILPEGGRAAITTVY